MLFSEWSGTQMPQEHEMSTTQQSAIDVKVEVVLFLQHYAEINVIMLLGRIPGYKCDDLQLLPSSITKKGRCVSSDIV